MSPKFCSDETENHRRNGDDLGYKSLHQASNEADEKGEQYDYVQPGHGLLRFVFGPLTRNPFRVWENVVDVVGRDRPFATIRVVLRVVVVITKDTNYRANVFSVRQIVVSILGL